MEKDLSILNPFKNRLSRFVWLATVATATFTPPCSHAAAPCQTTVNGVIEGETWTVANSPYCVNGDVLVSSLVIQPGVEVRFVSNYVFVVEGRLKVDGAVGNEVRFTTTNAAVGWQGICFLDALPGSFFNNCIIEYSKNSAVRITNSPTAGGGVPTFTNCVIVNNSSPDYGGGIDIWARSGDLILEGCLIASNSCQFHGGGINAVLNNGTLKMIDCTIVSNVAKVGNANGSYVGGGVRVSGQSVLLNCLFADNICNAREVSGGTTTSFGGGIYSDSGDAVFRNCRFQRNAAQTIHAGIDAARAWGGAVYFQDRHLVMQNCTVETNTCSACCSTAGAGIFVGSGVVDIINCTIVGNNTEGVYRNGGTVTCLNSILYFNNSSSAQLGGTVNTNYCDIQGGAPGNGNISANPQLRGGTLELLSLSPCIDAGNPDSMYNDYCFRPEPLSSYPTERNDMGAYGGPGACCWAHACGAPVATSQPKSLTTCVASTALLCVTAIGDPPLQYQWRFHGTNVSNAPTNIASGTNACLTLSNVQSNNIGYYSLLVLNAFGSTVSNPAYVSVTPVCVDINLYSGLTLTGGVTGQAYRIDYVTNLNFLSWTALTTFTQNVSGVFVLDPAPANLQHRFYRVVVP
jgi:hypothetical protein